MSDNLQKNNNLNLLTPEEHQKLDEVLAKFDEKLVKIINFDKLEKNSVIFFEISPNVSYEFIMSLPTLLEKYESIIKGKDISVVIMPVGGSIKTLNEKEMEEVGWTKKDKSLIIRPN